MASKIFVTLAVSGLSVSGCFNTPISSVGSVTLVQGSRLAASGTTQSKSVSTVDSNSSENIQLSAPVIDGMSGAGVTIAPGSLGISVDLVVEQAADISDTSMMDEMGLAEDIQISSATPGMIIRPSENVDLKKPLAISMPLPVGLSFHLNTGSKYAILYKYFDPTEQRLVTGMKIMDGTNVKLSFDEASGKDVLSFDGYFGAYWAVILSREVLAAEVPPQKPAEQPIMNKANVPVISSAGVMKETEVVKTQSIAELIWAKTSMKFIPEQRSLSLQATVPADQKVTACKADLFENVGVRSGLVVDAPSGTQLEFVVNNTKAHTIVGRFRCLDSLGRITFTPWSDSIAIPAVPSIAPPISAPIVLTPGVEATNAGVVMLSGVLKPVKSLLLVTSSPGKGEPSFREIPVDATGYFSLPVDRSNIVATRVLSKLNTNPIVRDAAFIADIATLFQVSLAEANGHVGDYPDDIELKNEMLADVEAIANKGVEHGLVAFTKASGNRVAEATSFKFIGLPTPSANLLFQWNNKSFKGNVRLGEINVGVAGDETLSTVTSQLALNESIEMQEGLAAMGRTAKSIRNVYMNEGWQADPTFVWRSTRSFSVASSSYSLASAPIYQGYGFHIERRDEPVPYTYDTICNSGRLPLSFDPPAMVVAKVMDVDTNFTSFSNRDSYGSGPTGERTCNGPDFFAREENGELRAGFGNGSTIQGPVPNGLWRYIYNGTELARFNFSYFRPLDADGFPVIYIPTYKLIKDGSNYIGATVRFSIYSNGLYLPVTDLSVLRRLMRHAQFSFWGPSGNNYHNDLIFTDGSGDATVTFDNPIPDTDVNNAAAEYTLGDQRYRFEIQDQI